MQDVPVRMPDPKNGIGQLVVDGVCPSQLGVDRWLAMLGAMAVYPGRAGDGR